MYWCYIIISSEIKHSFLETGEMLIRLKKLRKVGRFWNKKSYKIHRNLPQELKTERKFQERRSSSAELSARYTGSSKKKCSVVCESSPTLRVGLSVFQLPLHRQLPGKLTGSLSSTQLELFLYLPFMPYQGWTDIFSSPLKEEQITQQLSIKWCLGKQRVLN